MQKKGDISINFLILFILALIVLVIVLIVFTQGFDALFGKIKWALDFVFDMKPEGL